MTEQQYRVVADRAVIGDKVDFETWDAGDLLVYRYPGRGNNPGELVRIERPVPTTQQQVQYDDGEWSREVEVSPSAPTTDENAWIDHELASPSAPTREQIAEESGRRYPALNPDADELTYPRSALREFKRGAFAEGVVWALALIQNGADR